MKPFLEQLWNYVQMFLSPFSGRIDVSTMLFLILAIVIFLKLRSIFGRRMSLDGVEYKRKMSGESRTPALSPIVAQNYIDENWSKASKWGLIGAVVGTANGIFTGDWSGSAIASGLAGMLILNAIVTRRLIWTGRFGEAASDAEELLCFLYLKRNKNGDPPGIRPFPTDAEIQEMIREVLDGSEIQEIG